MRAPGVCTSTTALAAGRSVARRRRIGRGRRRSPGSGAGHGQLDVGGVAALAAEDDLVLAGLAEGHVLVR